VPDGGREPQSSSRSVWRRASPEIAYMLLKNHWWRWNQEKGAFVGVAHVDIDFCALAHKQQMQQRSNEGE